MITYDEGRLAAELSDCDRAQKTAFAAACAASLLPLLERCAETLVGRQSIDQLQHILDECWTVAAGGLNADLSEAAAVAGSLVPDEDEDDWVVEVAYAQNAAAAVEYACRTWMTDDAQQAAWAARQVYEAADQIAQQSMPPEQSYDPSGDADGLLHSSIVQQALADINADLADVRRLAPPDWKELRHRAARRSDLWFEGDAATLQ